MTPPSELKRLAEGASKQWSSGVWLETDGDEWRATGPACAIGEDETSEPGEPAEQQAQKDASYIAAADPQTILGLLAEVDHLTDNLDLNIDEFQRIKAALTGNDSAMANEIRGLCDRAEKVTRQRVPVIQQRDDLENEVHKLCREVDDKEAAYQNVSGHVQRLKGELSDARARIAELEKEAAEMRKDRERLNQAIDASTHPAKIDSPEA